MENLSHSSYPDSTTSSPRSRDIDDTHSFDDQPPTTYKVKLLCSYGGKIQPRPHDNQLSYIGGDTKILAVDRHIKFSVFLLKLNTLCYNGDSNNSVFFKYQLPGEDLDALISVTNDEDLEHMMLEYDRLYRASAKPARLRLFLFQVNQTTCSFGSNEAKPDRRWFVDALNSVKLDAPVQTADMPVGNADFLFGPEEAAPHPPEPEFTAPDVSGEYYHVKQFQKVDGKIAPPSLPPPYMTGHVPVPVMMQVPAYLPERQEQTLYQIPYQAPTMRPVTGQVGQGYYPVQQQQQVYNVVGGPAAQQPPPQGYLQVGYDSAGRQVYYTTNTIPAAAPAPQAVFPVPVSGALNQDGKVQVVGGNVMAPPQN